MSASIKSCGIIIVNYASAELALAALASAWGARPLEGGTRIILVDNASPDDSPGRLVDVLTGRVPAPVMEPRPGVVYALPSPDDVTFTTVRDGKIKADMGDSSVTIILSDRNDGFAAGCNIGLRLVQAWGLDMALLLNPDAVMTLGTLNAFADAFEDNPKIGLAGATIRHFEPPFAIQAAGGAALSHYTLLGQNALEGLPLEQVPTNTNVEISYPHGAAMAARLEFIKDAGLMDESYFLYYEEADWVAAGDGWQTAWVSGASVFHHRGAVTESHLGGGGRSAMSDYHMVRSRMIYAKKWRPMLLPLLLMVSMGQALRRALRGQHAQAKAVLRAAFGWGRAAPSIYRPASGDAKECESACPQDALPKLSS